MGRIVWIVVAFLAGAFLPLQGGFNALLGKEAKNPMYASMFSFIIGTILIALYVFTTGQTVAWEGVRAAPWYAWLGGLFGAYCLTAIILAFPNLGPGLTFGLLIAGQNVFICGDDTDALAKVEEILDWFGWKAPIDLGSLSNARYTEMLSACWMPLFSLYGTPYFNYKVMVSK